MNPDIPDIGEIAPDFESLTSEGETFRLQQALNTGRNVLLLFYRGHW
jgi:peroxiredoxin